MTIDKQEMPFLSLIRKIMKTKPAKGGDYKEKYQESAQMDTQYWDGRDRLEFSDFNRGFDLEFGWSRSHLGLELVHTEIEEIAGYTITPNSQKGRGVGSKQPGVDGDILYNFVEEKMKEYADIYDVNMDKAWLTEHGTDDKAPVGLDELLPIGSYNGTDANPFASTYGGKARSNPLLQHQVKFSTVAATGITTAQIKPFMDTLKAMRRKANLYSRQNSGSIDVFMVGSAWLDTYQEIIESKEYRYAGSVDSPISSANLGITDTGLKYMGVPIMHNPTFELLDEEGSLASGVNVPWTCRCYMLNTKNMRFYNAPGKDKTFSVPTDPYDQRVSRFSYEGRYSMNLKNIRGFAIHAIQIA